MAADKIRSSLPFRTDFTNLRQATIDKGVHLFCALNFYFQDFRLFHIILRIQSRRHVSGEITKTKGVHSDIHYSLF